MCLFIFIYCLKVECLRESVDSLKVFVKSIGSKRVIECSVSASTEAQQVGLFDVSFLPELVERHILEIYFDSELVNKSKWPFIFRKSFVVVCLK